MLGIFHQHVLDKHDVEYDLETGWERVEVATQGLIEAGWLTGDDVLRIDFSHPHHRIFNLGLFNNKAGLLVVDEEMRAKYFKHWRDRGNELRAELEPLLGSGSAKEEDAVVSDLIESALRRLFADRFHYEKLYSAIELMEEPSQDFIAFRNFYRRNSLCLLFYFA